MDLITTAAAVYPVPETAVIYPTTAWMGTERGIAAPVPLVQYDNTLPILAVALRLNGQPYTVPEGAAVNIRMDKRDGHYVYNPALGVSEDRQTAYIGVTLQMTTGAGEYWPTIEIVIDGQVAGTSYVPLLIAENPVPEDAIESTDEYKTIQQLAVAVTQAAKDVTDNLPAINAIGENIDNINAVAQNSANISAVGGSITNVNSVAENLTPIQTTATNIAAIQQAPQQAANAAASATLSESWAVGGTGTREGEDTNNAKYWAEQAQSIAQGGLGWYETEQALQAAHPTGQNGQWAIIGTTDTIWTWDSDTSAWVDSGAQVDLSNYYTKQQADAAFATAAQGQLAQSAVQSVNGKTGGEIELSPADIGAATADQGQLAQTSMQSVWVAGVGQVLNKENQKIDLLQINTTSANSPENTPYFFGSNSPSTDITNTPYSSGPFYGYRQTLVNKYYSTDTPHLITVLVFESYPVPGRTWGNTYDDYAKNWIGWKQNGVQSAAFAYDEMAAAYNEGVASVGQ